MTTLSDDDIAEVARGERVLTDRVTWLLFAITELSQHGYLLIRWSQRQWRVTVRWNGLEHHCTSPRIDDGDHLPDLLPLLDQALEWLRAHHIGGGATS